MKIKSVLILSLTLVSLSTFVAKADSTTALIPTTIPTTVPSIPPSTPATDVYTIIHAAENNVINAEAVCQTDRIAQNLAAQELSQASSQEAVSLNNAVVANQVLARVAQNMYINSDVNKLNLIVDFSKRGLLAVSDQQEFDRISNQLSTTTIKQYVGTSELANLSTSATLAALDNYRLKTKDLNMALAQCQAALDNFRALSNSTGKVFLGTLVDSGFSTGTENLIGSSLAVSRALSFVDQPSLACADGTCFMLCDHLAGVAWGYANSGYDSAREHWAIMVATGHAHPNDPSPPLGALLFWDTGLYGHVATYVGNGMIVTNMYGDKGYGVYEIPASDISKVWGAPYLGWSDPVFAGQPIQGGGL